MKSNDETHSSDGANYESLQFGDATALPFPISGRHASPDNELNSTSRVCAFSAMPQNIASDRAGESENTESPLIRTNQGDDSLPSFIPLVRFGENPYSRNGVRASFVLREQDADSLIAEFTERGRDLVIDYEHQSLNGGEAPAAGWIDALEKSSDSLIGRIKYWTEHAAERLKKGEYRYFSPTFYFSEDGQNLKSIHSVALTNHPALHGIPALAASDSTAEDKETPDSTTTTDRKEDSAAATGNVFSELFAEDAGAEDAFSDLDGNASGQSPEGLSTLKEKLASLIAFSNDAKAFLKEKSCVAFSELREQRAAEEHAFADLSKALELARMELNERAAEALVNDAMNRGRLANASKNWALDFALRDPEGFKAWTDAAPLVLPCSTETVNALSHLQRCVRAPQSGKFTQEQRKVLRMLGVGESEEANLSSIPPYSE